MPQKAPQKCLIEALYEIGEKRLKIFDKELDLTKLKIGHFLCKRQKSMNAPAKQDIHKEYRVTQLPN